MNAVILTETQYQDLINTIQNLGKKLEKVAQKPKSTFLDNQDFIQLMHISKRTAQTWRDNGTIPFSQVGSKIYYLRKDVDQLLNEYYKRNTNTSKN
ncbi:helix-turn-helix domain-containing protein [Wenyingzhuangia sp. IMCC45574]